MVYFTDNKTNLIFSVISGNKIIASFLY